MPHRFEPHTFEPETLAASGGSGRGRGGSKPPGVAAGLLYNNFAAA
jgi:hypothetical protein